MSATDEGFTNQRKTEPIPATPAHDEPTGSEPERPDAESGSVSGPGARMSEQPGASAEQTAPAESPTGVQPGERGNEPDLAAGTTQAPHDAGRPEAQGAGSAVRAPGQQGDTPEPIETDVAGGATRTQEGITSEGTSEPASGVPHPVAPSYFAAAGTSETSEPVNGVRIPAVVQPGKPDGEVDTRS